MTMTPEEAENDLRWSLDETEPCRIAYNKLDANHDVEQWTGSWTNSTTPEVAEALCRNEDGTPCHVLEKCLMYAILNEQTNFIYGGKTPEQRKEIARARRLRTKAINARLTENEEAA